MQCVKGGSHVDTDELALAKLENSALLYGRAALHLVIAAFGFDALSFQGEDEDGCFIQIFGQKVRAAGELRDLAERHKRGELD
jgi:hypothetical protein